MSNSQLQPKTLLFFDDQLLSLRHNMIRKIGQPELLSVYRDPNLNLQFSYPSVFRDEATGMWRMIYQGNNIPAKGEKRQRVALAADSEDGVNWAPRNTTDDIQLDDRLADNQVLPTARFLEMCACYIDPHAIPSERVKGLSTYRRDESEGKGIGTRLWVSPDGIQWKLKEGVEWQKDGTDPNWSVFWNEIRESYVFTSRPANNDRRVVVYETKDWSDYSKPELLFQADSQDTPNAEIYGMPVVPYEGHYIGLLWMFHTTTDINQYHSRKYVNGKIDCQLAYSFNGWHFQRSLRDPFVSNGGPGEPTGGCVFPSSIVQREDGSLRIYAAASRFEHGNNNAPNNGSIVTYQMRQDGFVYLEAGGGEGIVRTRPIYLRDGEVTVNVQSEGGRARAQIIDFTESADPQKGEVLKGYSLDESIPFTSDSTSWEPQWKDGKSLRDLVGRTIMIELHLVNSRLYALRGDFRVFFSGAGRSG
ncbi:hypothetical protein [Paenibacillus koleovorans]|uniref:hypothetical protein n=1 Tax=Paenibacillus koleovorans TaxID=121608 RepID=UPI000FDB5155|nr:hypothetical protein [Paenibacillus koleovorans]